jgi:uncharacterized protein (TIGR02246 family)
MASLMLAAGILITALAARGTGQERVGHHPAPHDANHEADEKAINDNRAAYARAFESGDAHKAAELWSPDGELVEPDGHIIRGRAAIEKDLAGFFAENGPAKIRITGDSLRFPAPDVALESGSCQVTRARDGTASAAAYSIVHVKKDGTWYLASVRESNGPTAGNGVRLADLEWLVGHWTAKGEAVTADLSCEWSEGKNSLVRKYKTRAADGTARNGFQVIARDPTDGAIRAWMFDSDGGLGTETWTKDGDRWVVEAVGVAKDGRETTSTNLLKPISQDSYTWRSVERTIDGVSLPDTPEVTVRRDKK